ncbi:hypothetical protein [Pendulispora albinea]|uniref:EGF-like domain-containing protein n=1 Tax=Pendulispora albinea TaxID=2741071 RepID=A0ABZ2M5V1_9BACT
MRSVAGNRAAQGLCVLATAVVLLMAGAPGCGEESGVGDPCRPEVELDPTSNGFLLESVFTETKSYQCRTRVCLVNHFQGRVSCPYGQNRDGTGPGGGSPCVLPGTSDGKVVGGSIPDMAAEVKPQCASRSPDQAVYCSCRCANNEGRTDDGANYCTCPDGFSCERVGPNFISNGPRELSGAYCIKSGTRFDGQACTVACDPKTHPCP